MKEGTTMKTKLVLIAGLFLLTSRSMGQGSGFTTDPIKVVRAYEAVLSDALKFTPVPVLPTLESEKKEFSYSAVQKIAPTPIELTPMTPMRAMAEPPSPIANNYFKAGFGNYTTPLIKGHFMSRRDPKFEYGVDFSHFSSRGDLRVDTNKFDNANLSDNTLGVYGKRYMRNVVVNSNFNFERNVRHFYGAHQPIEIPADSIRQVFRQFSGALGVNSYQVANDQLDFGTQFSFYTIADAYEQSENNLRLDGKLLARLDENKVTFDFAFDYTNYNSIGGFSVNRSLVYFQPRYEYQAEKFRVTGGLNMAMQASGGVSLFQFYPVIDLDYKVADVYMIAYAGITGNIERNSFRDVIRRNPFVGTGLDIRNTNNRFQLYGGLKGSIDEITSYDVSMGYQRLQDAMFFLNDTADFTRLLPVYDSSTNVFKFNATVLRKFGDKYTAKFEMAYTGFGLSTLAAPFMQPTFTMKVGGSYQMQQKLRLTGDIFVFNGVKYLDNAGLVQELNGVFDLNLGADYRYSDKLGFFVQLNNLTAARYFRWFNYTSYGINVLGGLSFNF